MNRSLILSCLPRCSRVSSRRNINETLAGPQRQPNVLLLKVVYRTAEPLMQNGLRLRPQQRKDLRVSVSPVVGESSPLEAHGAESTDLDQSVRPEVWTLPYKNQSGINLFGFDIDLSVLFCSALTAQSTFSEESSRLIKKPTPHSFNFSWQRSFQSPGLGRKWLYVWGQSAANKTLCSQEKNFFPAVDVRGACS